ncbi:MAG: hypothetical protein Q4E87_01425 [bacterium]|nr:hypothetical protein [bacterium]
MKYSSLITKRNVIIIIIIIVLILGTGVSVNAIIHYMNGQQEKKCYENMLQMIDMNQYSEAINCYLETYQKNVNSSRRNEGLYHYAVLMDGVENKTKEFCDLQYLQEYTEKCLRYQEVLKDNYTDSLVCIMKSIDDGREDVEKYFSFLEKLISEADTSSQDMIDMLRKVTDPENNNAVVPYQDFIDCYDKRKSAWEDLLSQSETFRETDEYKIVRMIVDNNYIMHKQDEEIDDFIESMNLVFNGYMDAVNTMEAYCDSYGFVSLNTSSDEWKVMFLSQVDLSTQKWKNDMTWSSMGLNGLISSWQDEDELYNNILTDVCIKKVRKRCIEANLF